MKVPGSNDSESVLKRVQEGRVGEQAVVRKASSEGAAQSSVGSSLTKAQVDTVKFSSLGAVLSQELDPTKMVEERRAKIEALKEQIRNGTYAPSSESIAQSVSEEIGMEIVFGARFLSDDKA